MSYRDSEIIDTVGAFAIHIDLEARCVFPCRDRIDVFCHVEFHSGMGKIHDGPTFKYGRLFWGHRSLRQAVDRCEEWVRRQSVVTDSIREELEDVRAELRERAEVERILGSL